MNHKLESWREFWLSKI